MKWPSPILILFLILILAATVIGAPDADGQSEARWLVISGRVVDGDGRALPGASVSLAPVMDDHEGYTLRLGPGMWAEPVASVRTGEDGRYALVAEAGRKWRLIVEHPGRVMLTRRLEPLFEDRELAAADIFPARALEVRVRAEGRPVAGARVTAHSLAANLSSWPESWGAGITDDAGRTLLSVPRLGPWSLEVGAAGLVPAFVKHGGGAAAEVVLTRGSRLDLRLLLAAGRPAAGALVFRPATSLTLARADAEGKVSLFGEPGSRQPVRILTAHGAALETEVEFPARGKPAERRTLELLPPRELDVQVVVAGSLEPVAGAVAWGRDDHVELGDAQGRLTLTVPSTEPSISLTVVAPRHLLWKENRLAVSMAGSETLTVGLEPAADLRGQVMDTSARPLAGAEIWVMPERDPRQRSRFRNFAEGRHGRSGADGHFVLTQLPAAARLGLVARKAGYAPAYVDVDALSPQAASRQLELVLETGRNAVGTVLDEAGLPVAGASVELLSWCRPDGDSRHAFLAAAFPQAAFATDATGRFELRDLGTAKFDLKISAAGFVGVQVPGLQVGGGAGSAELGTFSLRQGMRLAGQVVDEQGLPMAGAEVYLGEPGEQPYPSEPGSSRLVTDSRGHFEFIDRAAGSYQIRARAEGFSVAESGRLETPLVEPVVLVLGRGVKLTGRVVDSRGDAIVGAEVRSNQNTGGRSTAQTTSDPSGHFELAGLRPARHSLTFKARGFRLHQRQVQVLAEVPGEPLEVVLERGATVSGQIRRPDGRPAPAVRVQVEPIEAEGSTSRGRSDSAGQFEIEEVPLGPAVVVARLGGTEIRQQVVVEPAGARLSLTVAAGVEVSGRAHGAGGEPVPSAQVTLRSVSGGRFWATSVDDGGFTFTDVVPGSYVLEIRHPDYAAFKAESQLEVATEAVFGLEAHLSRGAVVSGRLEGLELEVLSAARISLRGTSLVEAVAPDYQGAFRFEHVQPGKYRVRAESGSEVLARAEIELSAEQEEAWIELVPASGVELRGRVLLGGEGVANVRVRVADPQARRDTSYTSADGTFVLQGVSEGPHELSIGSHSDHRHERLIEVREGQEVVVELPTGELSGQVRDAETGEPLAGAKIDLRPLEGSNPWAEDRHSRSAHQASAHQASAHQATADSVGVYLMRELEKGLYRLRAKHEGYGSSLMELEVGTAALRQVDLELVPSDGLVLRVLQDGGSEVMHIALFDRAGNLVQEAIGRAEDGRASFPSAPTGDWRLWVRSETSAWVAIDVSLPGDEVAVALTPAAQLVFSVPGQALEDLEFDVRDAEGRSPPTLPDAGRAGLLLLHGRGYVGHLWPGQWTLELRHPDGRSWRSTFMARAGKMIPLELR